MDNKEKKVVYKAQFTEFKKDNLSPNVQNNLSLLDDVSTTVDVKFAQVPLLISEIKKFQPGYILPLNRTSDDVILDVTIGDKKIAKGEIVVVNDELCLRITEV